MKPREIELNRIWAMPNKNTFRIKPIKDLILRYIGRSKKWIDPFAGDSLFNSTCMFTNDLSSEFDTTDHLESLEFLKQFDDESVDGVLFDPPYNLSQLKECYNSVGKEIYQREAQHFWRDRQQIIASILKVDGIVVCFGWNSNGMDKSYGFEIIEILLVPHGGVHYDTICVVSRKVGHQFKLAI